MPSFRGKGDILLSNMLLCSINLILKHHKTRVSMLSESEVVELLWHSNVEKSKHDMYLSYIEKCVKMISIITKEFESKLNNEANFDVLIKYEDSISPDAGPMFGSNIIIFQVKLIIEFIKFYEELYSIENSLELSHKHARIIILSISAAFMHELTHIIRGHDSTVIDFDMPDKRAERASETDADFLAGTQLHKWYTGAGVGDQLMNNIYLSDVLIRMPIFFKDVGSAVTLLPLFFFCKFKSGNTEYHSPNARNAILMSGFVFGIESQLEEHGHFLNLFVAGHEEIVSFLKKHDNSETYSEYLEMCNDECSTMLNVTADDMDHQRERSDSISEIWNVLYSSAKSFFTQKK